MLGEIEKHASGATATKLDESWNLIPFAGLQAAARRFFVGEQRHGARNWEQGDDAFAEQRLKHFMRHAALFVEYRRQEDLDAVLCNAMMLAKFKERGFLKERKDEKHG